MKKITLLFFLAIVCSCNKKIVELPEISHSDITDIQDVSAAYLFYDETQPDSIELNRKNLISTTNWLVNIDKRLILRQVIPHIQFLQDKKANGAHKNEHAKNYFTCHDTSRNNLGFVEFTEIIYHSEEPINFISKTSDIPTKYQIILNFSSKEDIEILHFVNLEKRKTNLVGFKNYLKNISNSLNKDIELLVGFKETSSFQDYISIKSKLLKLDLENVTISKNEFIY
ncbi:hypothetical protein E1J38_006925 [Seonamhaeicola sediminis]|uniref:Lipoprotein n=1 Tax=Seonamhaeicola sediminis TaxID=2528206 RepID=A0A562YD81_9FLAO|nr:hypothetical protein [Seonamhaeicola sediminis]TWO32598.1 hypothetical protein E1J38_006925 [Seonamhaeicola sediminis]